MHRSSIASYEMDRSSIASYEMHRSSIASYEMSVVGVKIKVKGKVVHGRLVLHATKILA